MSKSKKKTNLHESKNEELNKDLEVETSAVKSKKSNKSNKSLKSLKSNKSAKSNDNLSEMDNNICDEEIFDNDKNDLDIVEEEKVIDFTKSRKTDLIHVLPAFIEYEGHAPVSTFFEPTIKKDSKNDEYFTSNFRGKLFRGKLVNHHIQFVEFKKLKNSELSEEEKNCDITKIIINDVENQKQFYVWEFDRYFEDKNDNLVNIKSILSDLDILS